MQRHTSLAVTCVLLLAGSMEVARAGSGDVDSKRRPPNTEQLAGGSSSTTGGCGAQLSKDLPFAVSIDGKPMDRAGTGNVADTQRCTDKALHAADIQVRYDGMQRDRRLDVLALPDAALKGEAVQFVTSANYHMWLERGEIRIFRKGQSVMTTPLATVPVTKAAASWTIPREADGEIYYTLRVYDHGGRFDETAPKVLKLADVRGGKLKAGDALAVYDGNSLAVRNINVSGGSVIVSGHGLAPGQKVAVMGFEPPVDSKGDFAIRQILPAGTHQVRVQVIDEKGRVSEFSRSAIIPANDFTYVALADVTAGRTLSSGPLPVTPDTQGDFDKSFVNGRLAFYLKGLVKGEYLLTASADTKEQPLHSLLSNFDSKDPTYLLRNLDPNKYYPIYGDDSTLVEDAPTRGKFYVRVDKGDSHVMWGNFKTSINGTEFVRYDRGLYGAQAKLVSEDSTKFGERRNKVEAFVAEPGTLGARDVFNGTGGSLFFLRRQNITQGSERITVETRDRNTGLVISSRGLIPVEDYEIDYLQGRVVLRNPLSTYGSSDFVVMQNATAGSLQFLVVNYEFAPDLTATTDKVAGGRASTWVNDHVQVGVTGYDQTTPGQDAKIIGSDVTVRYTAGTYIKVEGAHSTGPNSGEAVSADGGFTFTTQQSSGRGAFAGRVEAGGDLADLLPGGDGKIGGYWQHRDDGFSGPGQITIGRAATEAGLLSSVRLNPYWTLKSKADDKEDLYRRYRALENNFVYAANEHWKYTFGVRSDDNNVLLATQSPTLNQAGRRDDVAVRADYDSKQDWSVYGFAQATVDRTGDRDPNNRIGVGGAVRLTEKLTGKAEISEGNLGLGAKVGTEYRLDQNRVLYTNYLLDPDRTDIISRGGEGVLVSGVKNRFSDSASVYGEERWRHGGGFDGLTHAYGLDFVPYENWKAGVAAEYGTLNDPLAGDITRLAVSSTVGFLRDGLSYTGKLEYRDDKTTTAVSGGTSTESNVYLMRNTLGVKFDPDWRFVGRLNGAYATASSGAYQDGDYFEAVSGFAYRPVSNDRLNALFKYTYFYNVPSPGQITNVGLAQPYSQQSHVLSADANYDLTSWLTLGGKYALRVGELRDNTLPDGQWFNSTANLLIGRADFHFVKSWDLMGELRVLKTPTAGDTRAGALVGVYRHINDNFKMGAGYNFTRFSDDLTNLNLNNKGVFVNAIAKF